MTLIIRLSQEESAEIVRKSLVVHWLENVNGDPHGVRPICREYMWWQTHPCPLDPDRVAAQTVTCPKCLMAMADTPHIIGCTP